MTVKMFRAKRTSNRFNANQRVWVRFEFANHLWIFFRFRGKGRYVAGTIDKFDTAVGAIREIDVSDAFAARIEGDELDFARRVVGEINEARNMDATGSPS